MSSHSAKKSKKRSLEDLVKEGVFPGRAPRPGGQGELNKVSGIAQASKSTMFVPSKDDLSVRPKYAVRRAWGPRIKTKMPKQVDGIKSLSEPKYAGDPFHVLDERKEGSLERKGVLASPRAYSPRGKRSELIVECRQAGREGGREGGRDGRR